MVRYTEKQFENDLGELNEKLASAGIDRVYVAGYRYGYAAVDWGDAEDIKRYRINGTVCAGGSKRKMIAGAREDCLKYL